MMISDPLRSDPDLLSLGVEVERLIDEFRTYISLSSVRLAPAEELAERERKIKKDFDDLAQRPRLCEALKTFSPIFNEGSKRLAEMLPPQA